jgi:hypothetical protein
MARYRATVASRRPAPDTFGYLATFSNAAEWDPGVISAGQLDPGPVRPGTRFRLTVPFLRSSGSPPPARPGSAAAGSGTTGARAEYRPPWTREAPGVAQLLWGRIDSGERLGVPSALGG